MLNIKDSKETIELIFSHAERYIWGDDYEKLMYHSAPIVHKGQKIYYPHFIEGRKKDYIKQRNQIIKLSKSSKLGIEVFEELSRYSYSLCLLTKHLCLLDPLVVTFIDSQVRLIEKRTTSVEGRRASQAILKDFLGGMVPDLKKIKAVKADEVKIAQEYEIIKEQIRRVINKDNKVLNKICHDFFPEINDKLNEEELSSLLGISSSHEFVLKLLRYKYRLSEERIKTLITAGRSTLEFREAATSVFNSALKAMQYPPNK